jgi:maltooligosyltrehalose trehalohydrolase
MIKLSEVGAFASIVPGGFQIKFALYLPGIRADDRFDVVERVIHSADRFNPSIQPVDFLLTWNSGHPSDLWSFDAPITTVGGTNFGSQGIYLYIWPLSEH